MPTSTVIAASARGPSVRPPTDVSMVGARSRKLRRRADLDGPQHLFHRQDVMAHQEVELVAQVGAQHLRAIRADGEADLVLDERAHHPAHLADAAQHARVEVRARADLEHRAALAQHGEHARILSAADAVADPVRLERLERLPHLVGASGLTGVDRQARIRHADTRHRSRCSRRTGTHRSPDRRCRSPPRHGCAS